MLKHIKKESIRSQRAKSIYARMLSFEEARLRAIEASPDITNLLMYSPDNGKTQIYCKDDEQLSRAKETFKNLRKREYSVIKE